MDKKCKKCGVVKDETKFSISRKREDGSLIYSNICPVCKAKESKRRRKEKKKILSQKAIRKASVEVSSVYLDSEANGEKFYKIYNTPGGKVGFTLQEFQHVVETFEILKKWRDEHKRRPNLNIEPDQSKVAVGGLSN